MFTQEYFCNRYRAHSDNLINGATTAIIHLHNGTQYFVSQFVEAAPDVLVIRVFPPPGTEHMTRKRHAVTTGDIIDDQVVLPYETINHLLFTVMQADPMVTPERRTIGFGETPRMV